MDDCNVKIVITKANEEIYNNQVKPCNFYLKEHHPYNLFIFKTAGFQDITDSDFKNIIEKIETIYSKLKTRNEDADKSL